MALFHKVIRTMLSNKSRYIGSILLLTVSSMMFVMLHVTSCKLDNSYTQFAQNNQLSDVEFSVEKPIDTAALSAEFQVEIELGGTADCEAAKGQTLRIFSMMDRVNLPAAQNGRLPRADEVMLDLTFAAVNGYRIGDRITINGSPYTICGTGYLPNYIYIIQSKDEIINDFKHFGIGVMAKSDYEQLAARNPVYALRFDSRENRKSQEAAIKNALRQQGSTILNWQSTDQKVNVSYIPMEISVIGTMSTVVPFAMLLLSCVLLGLMMQRMILSESTMIGTLYAQGYRIGELRRHYLLYPLLVSILGSTTGTIAGLLLNDIPYSFLLTAFPMPRYHTPIQPWLILTAFLLPIVILCGISLIVTGRILKTPPAILMKGHKDTVRLNVMERHLRSLRFRFTTKFQIREQLRSLSRSCFLILGIIIASMLMLYGFTLKSSVNYMLDEGIKSLYQLEYEYVFKEEQTKTPPDGTEPFGAAYVSLKSDEEVNFYISGILPDTQMIHLKDTSGRDLDGSHATITAPLAKKLGIKAGDSLLVFDTEDGSEHTVTIDQLADTYAGDFLFMPLSSFNAEFNRPVDSYNGIWCKEPISINPEEIQSTKSIQNTVKAFQSLIDQMVPMVYMLIVAAFAVGLIIIYIVTGLVVEENRHTISLFKVFGYRKKEINRLILDSNTLLVAAGYLISIPALLATVGVFYESLTASLQLVLPVKLNFGYLVLGFFIVIITYESAKFMCRKKVNAIPMSEAIKAGEE